MKHGYGIIYTLMALSLVIAGIFLPFAGSSADALQHHRRDRPLRQQV